MKQHHPISTELSLSDSHPDIILKYNIGDFSLDDGKLSEPCDSKAATNNDALFTVFHVGMQHPF